MMLRNDDFGFKVEQGQYVRPAARPPHAAGGIWRLTVGGLKPELENRHWLFGASYIPPLSSYSRAMLV